MKRERKGVFGKGKEVPDFDVIELIGIVNAKIERDFDNSPFAARVRGERMFRGDDAQGAEEQAEAVGSFSAEEALDRLSEYFSLDKESVRVLVMMVETRYQEDDAFDLGDVGEFYGISKLGTLKCRKHLRELVKKNYMRVTFFSGRKKYDVDGGLLRSVEENGPLKLSARKVADRYDFVNDFAMIYECGDFDCASDKIGTLGECEGQYRDMDFVKKVRSLIPDDVTRYMFIDICRDYIHGGKSHIMATLRDIMSDFHARSTAEKIMDGTHFLVERNLAEFTDNNSVEDAKITLAEGGKELFLGEDRRLFEKKFGGRDMIMPDKIDAKNMFYSDDVRTEIDKVRQYLGAENYSAICRRMKECKMKQGFAILFYGGPGTGKTETACQLARETGRPIVKVDISETKSCWFGESEKRIKEVFDKYRNAVRSAREAHAPEPILLFNEADAVLSGRRNFGDGRSAVDQTENAMQNIILDEMENLDGIMIATTNLIDNLDAAFERRFLYKVKFANPLVGEKKRMWEDKLAGRFDDAMFLELAESYDFSGGQIDNIARKALMREMLGGACGFDEVKKYCAEEKIQRDGGSSCEGWIL